MKPDPRALRLRRSLTQLDPDPTPALRAVSPAQVALLQEACCEEFSAEPLTTAKIRLPSDAAPTSALEDNLGLTQRVEDLSFASLKQGASAVACLCDTGTSSWRNLATLASGVCLLFAVSALLQLGVRPQSKETNMEHELVAALLGTEFRESEAVQQLSRLAWLKTLLDSCREPEVEIVLAGNDPASLAKMLGEVEALLRDVQAVLIRSSALPGPLA